jgi:hypothetical protein
MSRVSSKCARTALHMHILVNILVYAFCDDLRLYLDLRWTYHIVDGDLLSMLLSIYYHMESMHLFMNMMDLHWYGSKLCTNVPSRLWWLVFAVMSLYVLCGIGAFAGIELLSCFHKCQWDWKLVDTRYLSRCTHWVCDVLNDALRRDVMCCVLPYLRVGQT